jgi:hypothetical protein
MTATKTIPAVLSATLALVLALSNAPESAPVTSPTTSPVALGALPFGAAPDLRLALGIEASPSTGGFMFPVIIGADTNNDQNPFVQPQNPALAGGGIDQSLQNFDLVLGDYYQPSILIGLLGEDVLAGGTQTDIIIGGPEHGNPRNRDKAYGGLGDDMFLWAPGDGDDFFDGGPGLDTIVFGRIGERDATGALVFQGSNNQLAGDVWIDPITGLPRIDVTNSPGFCEIIDPSSAPGATQELQAIGVQRLARFFVRGVNQSFVNGTQSTDNGLRVTLHLVNVEFLVCTSRQGGAIEAFDLRTTPPTPVPFSYVPLAVQYVAF